MRRRRVCRIRDRWRSGGARHRLLSAALRPLARHPRCRARARRRLAPHLGLRSPSSPRPPWSSLPGWLMPGGGLRYPDRAAVLAYLAAYEERYALPVRRPVWVQGVTRDAARLHDPQRRRALARPRRGQRDRLVGPDIRSRPRIRGRTSSPERNSIPPPTATPPAWPGGPRWWSARVTRPRRSCPSCGSRPSPGSRAAHRASTRRRGRPRAVRPRHRRLPRPARPRVGLRTRRRRAGRARANRHGPARARGARPRRVADVPPFTGFTPRGVVWPERPGVAGGDGDWATGFAPALGHLCAARRGHAGRARGHGRHAALAVPGLWLVGYGDWTGFASATLVGVAAAPARPWAKSAPPSPRAPNPPPSANNSKLNIQPLKLVQAPLAGERITL